MPLRTPEQEQIKEEEMKTFLIIFWVHQVPLYDAPPK
jgi:hypothetical protein